MTCTGLSIRFHSNTYFDTSSHVPKPLVVCNKNEHGAILIGGSLAGLSLQLFNKVNLLLVMDPHEVTFNYPRPVLHTWLQSNHKFYLSPVALRSRAGGVFCIQMAASGAKSSTWVYRWMAAWSK